MIKRKNIPTLIGILILIVGTFAGVFFLRMNQVFKIGASATAAPKDIRTSNLTDSSATISWITEGQTTDFISWGETQGNLNKIEKESDTDQKFFTHSVTITGLKANTTYFYKINSDGTDFDNSGIPWQFTTGAVLSVNQNSIPISGSVITASGQPSKRSLVYLTIDGYILSTLTSDEGNFVLQIGNARISDLKSYIQISGSQTLLVISITAQGGESASAQIFPQSANPIPPLILGQVKDYRSLEPSQSGQNPNADLNLPANTNQESKFDVSTTSGVPATKSVILESLTEGEVITSTEPQFFGKGPAGETITVTIHSEQSITQAVQIPKNGSWSYSPETPLSAGSHSITISWIDATGITRTLTRNFVVQASELPAFVSTPSGSTPTPTPKITLVPTSTPRATFTPLPTPTRSIAPSTTPKPVPVTGDLTPTLLLSIMGLVVLGFSVFVWKTAEN